MEEDYRIKFIDAVNKTIARKELKHIVIANHIGISATNLSNYLTGRRKIPFDIAIRLMLELHIDMNALFQADDHYVLDDQEYQMMKALRELPKDKREKATLITLQMLKNMK